jgi:hypothetical protein
VSGADNLARLAAVIEVARREARQLRRTDSRLFARPITPAIIAGLEQDEDLAERIDAFVARFGRLQDTLANKVLPLTLAVLAEPAAPMIDVLNRAERLGLIASAANWLAARELRNRVIHEYVRDSRELVDALAAAHASVPLLAEVSGAVSDYLRPRFPEQAWP